MLHIPMIEIFTRLIPEAFLLVLSAHVFTKTALDKKKYILSSILFGISNYIIRSLPIDYGIHMVLGFIIFVVIITYIVGINPLKSIQVVFISTILIMLSEVINVGIINYVFRQNLDVIFADSTLKSLYGIPSLAIFAIIIALYYLIVHKRKNKYV